MKNILPLLAAALMSLPATADHHGAVDAALLEAVEAFNEAYLTNDVERYFGLFSEDAHLYWGGERQAVPDYRNSWTAMIARGGGVEKDEASDLKVRMLPGGNGAMASYFVDYRMRTPEGEIYAERAFESVVWQKIDGDWKVVGLHYSTIPPE